MAKRQLTIKISVSLWLDGDDPGTAQVAQAFSVAHDFVRVRVANGMRAGAAVRLKAPFRSRSIAGRIEATGVGIGPSQEITISAPDIGPYFGVAFPKTAKGSDPEKQPEAPPIRKVPEPLKLPEKEQPAPDRQPQPRPVPERMPLDAPQREMNMTISGIDSAYSPFSQTALATMDSSGSVKVPLRQLIDLGARVRVNSGGSDSERRCRIDSRSPIRTSDGFWIYRLVFEDSLDPFREFEPPFGSGHARKPNANPILAGLNAVRAVLVALLYELRKRASSTTR